MSKRALITGVTGQDGSYLAELLLSKGYEVHGMVRRLGSARLERLSESKSSIHFVEGDLLDQTSLESAVKKSRPDEVYNLAAPSFVASSFSQPVLTGDIVGIGAVRMFEAVRTHAPGARVYQASSSEMFGAATDSPQNENTPFDPRTPYGVAKTFAFWTGVNCRRNSGMFVSNGILYNHESPRRGPEYVTRKITLGVARIAKGLQERIELGNLDGRRDWGYAPEYVEAMWRMLQLDEANDFVIATGETHTVRELLEEACKAAGIPDPMSVVSVSQGQMRPADFVHLRGDASKAKRKLGWEPRTRFRELVGIMVKADLERVSE
ncbi:MAG: GDP-mannose 4,6-dehydratase [Thermoplasmata archaeon]